MVKAKVLLRVLGKVREWKKIPDILQNSCGKRLKPIRVQKHAILPYCSTISKPQMKHSQFQDDCIGADDWKTTNK